MKNNNLEAVKAMVEESKQLNSEAKDFMDDVVKDVMKEVKISAVKNVDKKSAKIIGKATGYAARGLSMMNQLVDFSDKCLDLAVNQQQQLDHIEEMLELLVTAQNKAGREEKHENLPALKK
jgi:phage gp29-like protein